MSAALSPAQVRDTLIVAGRAVQDARARLTELDALAGDGDLGESLVIGFRAVDAALDELEADTVGPVLRATGRALSTAAPSTLGTLLGLGLVDASRVSADATSMDVAALEQVLQAIADGIGRRGEVVPGQRTVLDGVAASLEAVRLLASPTVAAAFAAAASGAVAGARATASMRPQVGRAGWVGERVQGVPDAGAEAWSAFMNGWSQGVIDAAG